MKTFGLIGKSLSHSFSARYFNKKFYKEKIISYDWYFPSDFNQETMLAILLIVVGILVVYSLETFTPNKQ